MQGVSQISRAGFTLIELLVVLVVLAAVTSLAAPQFGRMLADNRVVNAANSAQTALQFARQHASRSAAPVIVCAVDGWAGGVEVREGDDCEGDILRQVSFAGGVNPTETPASTEVVFRPDGSADRALTLRLGAPSAGADRRIALFVSGHSAVERLEPGEGE